MRVDAGELRCRVVGEGGNLGLTQRARIEFGLAGGHVNTDAIDNSAGVDCSDHEVNIKILLDAVVAAGDLTRKQRDELLAQMTDEVAELVLTDNYEQGETLSLAEAQAASMIDVHARFIRSLEQAGRLDRELEALPSDEAIAERKAAGRGLTRPELATLVAYSKLELHDELVDSDVPEDPHLSGELQRYFPQVLSERFGAEMREHRLRREITATQVVNNMLHGGGTHVRVPPQRGARRAALGDRARLRGRPRRVRDAPAVVADRGSRQPRRRGAPRLACCSRDASSWSARRAGCCATAAARCRSRRPSRSSSPGPRSSTTRCRACSTSSRPRSSRGAWRSTRRRACRRSVAQRSASLAPMFSALDIVEVAHDLGLEVDVVAAVHFGLGARLHLHWLRERINELPRDDRWNALARAALREDLNTLHRGLTADVVRGMSSAADAGARIDAWIAGNPAAERCLATLDRHPERPRLRPHDAAGRGARGAQPDSGAGRLRPRSPARTRLRASAPPAAKYESHRGGTPMPRGRRGPTVRPQARRERGGGHG